jgi:hypothetical protein
MVDIEIDDCWSEYVTGTNRLGNYETRQETVSSPRLDIVRADHQASEPQWPNDRR